MLMNMWCCAFYMSAGSFLFFCTLCGGIIGFELTGVLFIICLFMLLCKCWIFHEETIKAKSFKDEARTFCFWQSEGRTFHHNGNAVAEAIYLVMMVILVKTLLLTGLG